MSCLLRLRQSTLSRPPIPSQSLAHIATKALRSSRSPSARPQPSSIQGTARSFHSTSRSYRQAFNYQRFQQSQHLLRRWANSRYFYYQLAAIGTVGGGYYALHIEEVPISHRRRFRNISFETEKAMGQQMYQQVAQQFQGQFLGPRDPAYQMVQRVARRLIPYSGLQEEKWEVNVIQSSEKNAFVIPGGKIFVFTGLLEIANTDDKLATVLGHEISHNVAHHAAERASSASILFVLAFASAFLTGIDMGLTNGLLDFVFSKPNSRAQESEADYLGLLMMSQACYNPHEAVELWQRMHEAEQYEIPQFLSTHPSNTNRMAKMSEWMSQADEKRAESGCDMIRPHATEFWSHALPSLAHR